MNKESHSYSILRFAYNTIDSLLFVKSNNAGVMATPFMLSKDNIEIQFATNHIGTLRRNFSSDVYLKHLPYVLTTVLQAIFF